jgi:type IV fimbrial biogenesis protein FimT
MKSRGFSLVELLITLAIFGILLATGASSFRTWINNMRVRTTAESIQNGLQLARGEAVRRNSTINFSLTSGLDAGCSLITTNTASVSSWVVSFDSPAGACNATPLNEAFSPSDAANNPAPRILQSRSAAESGNNVRVTTNQSSLVFNGLGRLVPIPANTVVISVTDTDANNCAPVGATRCLDVRVSAGGQVRMCDPALDAGGADPQRCTAGG